MNTRDVVGVGEEVATLPTAGLRASGAYGTYIARPYSETRMARSPAPGGANRADAIYLALRHAIIEQALEPGAKLPEDAIGERFGASRTIVRSALSRLASEGLAELRRNRGAAVASPSWDEARDLFDIRVSLERIVISRLAGNLTEAQIARLNAHVDQEEAARGVNEPLSIRLATEFHILLSEMTGSTVLATHVNQVASRCGLILALYSRPHSADCAVSEHRSLIEALAAGDAAKAVQEMDAHLSAVIGRALIGGARKKGDIRDVLARYVDVGVAASNGAAAPATAVPRGQTRRKRT